MQIGAFILKDTTEAFIVCQGYKPPEGYKPTMANPLLDMQYGKKKFLSVFVQFTAY